MTHFAFIAPPFPSHLRALEALAAALGARGHRTSWVQQHDVRALLGASGEGFRAVGARTHPPGSLAAVIARAARPGGPLGLARVIRDMAASTDMLCREAPAALADLGAEAIVADQMEAAGGLVAEALGLPCVSVACALPVNREPPLPLPVMPWALAADERGLRLNHGSARVHDWLMRPHARVIAGHARAFGLAPRERLDECLSPLLQLSQTTAGFDFPRAAAPAHLHHVGPLRAAELEEPPLGLPVETDRPFVFASLGTLQGGRFGVFRRIVLACRGLGAQLLVAHCGGLDARQTAALLGLGATWVTDFAPQRAAVARADVVVTHAGLNTVMDALAAGKPLLALPITFDQPGTAARIVHAGAGLRLDPRTASVRRLRHAIGRLLVEPAFRERAAALGAGVRRAGGAPLAAELVERAVRGGRPLAAGALVG